MRTKHWPNPPPHHVVEGDVVRVRSGNETDFWPDPNGSDMPVDIASRVASGLSVADGHVALAGKGQTDRLFQVAEFSRRSARPVVEGHRPFLRFRRAGLVSLRADRIGTDRFLLPPTLRLRPWPGMGAPEHSRQGFATLRS